MMKKTFLAFALGISALSALATPSVKISTNKGDFVVELDEDRAPATVANFLNYVKDGFYTDTIFHRVIPNFVIQGGGYDVNLKERPTREPIANEAHNGLENKRGTIAMARTNNPHSATSQFFINLVDNDALNPGGVDAVGYAVFGQVIEGMNIVDMIAKTKTTTKPPYANVPVDPIVIKSIEVLPEKEEKK